MPGGDLVSLDFAALDDADGGSNAAFLSPTVRPMAWEEDSNQQPTNNNQADQYGPSGFEALLQLDDPGPFPGYHCGVDPTGPTGFRQPQLNDPTPLAPLAPPPAAHAVALMAPNDPAALHHLVRSVSQQRWLLTEELCSVLANSDAAGLRPLTHTPQRPPSGSLFILDKGALRQYKKDGYSWRVRKDGKKVHESHDVLKVNKAPVMTAHYTMLDGQFLPA
jgi:hypothetical protein